jgi:2,3-bisphosphoglycerate-independent phosphoglycerate mutase
MHPQRKILIVVIDGMGDRAVRELDWKTPLQCAKRPNLNWYAENGVNGLMDVIAPGIRPGSDTSHLAILGYDPYEVYTGRGPFEAAGIGLMGQKGDVAFRCNFATIDERGNIIDRRAGRIKRPETTELVSSLSNLKIGDVEIIVKEATEHRAVLLLRGEGLSPFVTDVDPHESSTIQKCKPLVPEATKTAEIVNTFVEESRRILSTHPINLRRKKEGKPEANVILPRGAGTFPEIQPLEEKYGLSAACVAGVSLVKGICRICGMEVANVPGATGGIDTDMIAKAERVVQLLESKDLVLLNVKATDIASHDGDPCKKIEVIERVDSMIGYLRTSIPSETVVAILADHCSPIEVRDHSGDPVPVTIYCESGIRDAVEQFDEPSFLRGGLGRIRGKDLMPILLDKANRSKKFGA